MEKATASAGCWNVLVMAGSAAEEIAEFIVLSAEPVCCIMLLEAAHTSDPSLDSAMVLFKSIIIGHTSERRHRRVERSGPLTVSWHNRDRGVGST